MTILHVTTREAWEAAQTAGEYRTPDIEKIGFIHFCRPDQLEFVLDRYFTGKTGLVVLHVNSNRLTADLKFERSEPEQPPFPHLYGPLNLDAVESAVDVAKPPL